MTEDRRHNDELIMSELRGFRELFEERSNNIESTLGRLETKADVTNGRVTKLEMESAESRGKAKVSGVLWGGVTSVVVSVLAFFINQKI